jgi:hypothetical protein
MDSNVKSIFDFFQSERNIDLVPLNMVNMELLEERKFCIPFKKWRKIQLLCPSVHNVFWHICDANTLTFVELQNILDELNSKMEECGNKLISYLDHSVESERCLFFLYSFNSGNLTFFNSSVLFLNTNIESQEFIGFR